MEEPLLKHWKFNNHSKIERISTLEIIQAWQRPNLEDIQTEDLAKYQKSNASKFQIFLDGF